MANDKENNGQDKNPPRENKAPTEKQTKHKDKRPKKLKDWKSVVLVTCPRKGHIIGEYQTDEKNPKAGFNRKIKYREGQQRAAGADLVCAVCGSRYVVDGNTHTSIGWYPQDPVLEPVPIKRR